MMEMVEMMEGVRDDVMVGDDGGFDVMQMEEAIMMEDELMRNKIISRRHIHVQHQYKYQHQHHHHHIHSLWSHKYGLIMQLIQRMYIHAHNVYVNKWLNLLNMHHRKHVQDLVTQHT